MKEVANDFYVFHEAEEAEKAVEKMRKAIGKKNETAAAVRFARTMLELEGERMSVKDEAIQSRRALLNTYYKILAVKNWIQQASDFASRLAGKIYDEYIAQGGHHYEARAYCNGTTWEEERDKDHAVPYKPPVYTGSEQVKNAIASA